MEMLLVSLVPVLKKASRYKCKQMLTKLDQQRISPFFWFFTKRLKVNFRVILHFFSESLERV